MKAAAAALSLAALAGCYRTRFDLGPPQPEMPSAAYSDHFHFSVLNVVEISRPVDLQAACMGAPPTAIEEQIGILGAIVNAVFSTVVPIFHVHNATVYCPMGGQVPYPGGQPPMNGAYPPGQYPTQPQPYPSQPVPPQPMPPQPQ